MKEKQDFVQVEISEQSKGTFINEGITAWNRMPESVKQCFTIYKTKTDFFVKTLLI